MSELKFNNKYDNLESDQTDLYAKYESIIKFKRSLENIELLISLSEDKAQQNQLNEMKNSILQALNQEINQLKQLQKKLKVFSLSTQTLKQDDVGKLAKCYIQSQKKWRNSEVLEVDLQEQTAKVFQYGKNNQIVLEAYKLKVLKLPDPANFKENVFCKAIYSGDGEFYPCTIQKVDEQGYHVRYKKYNSREIIKLHRLREIKNSQEKPQYKFENLQTLNIPDKLKIQPNDPENIKKSKKTKVKALKFAFKNAQVDEINKQKQQKWKQFNTSGIKYGHFQTKSNITVTHKEKQYRQQPSKMIKKERVRYDTIINNLPKNDEDSDD